MFKTQSTSGNVASPAKNRRSDMKTWAWVYVVTALLYLIAGGPPQLGFLFLMMTFFAGALILQNSDRREQVAIACVMMLFLLINTVYMTLAVPGFLAHSEGLAAGFWIIDKLWYVCGLALFLPVLLDKFVKKTERRRCWAIVVAFSAQFVLMVFMSHEKQEESRAPVACQCIERLTCVPEVKPVSWYTKATLAEDLVFGLQVVLVMAAFSKKDDDPVPPKVN